MRSENKNTHAINSNFTVKCERCEKLMDWKHAQLLPGKILCRRCLVVSNFSEWFVRAMFSPNLL